MSKESAQAASGGSAATLDKNYQAEEKFRKAVELKLEGNTFFGQKNQKKAIRCYHKALLFIKGIESDASDLFDSIVPLSLREDTSGQHNRQKINPEILMHNEQLKIDCLNNLSACLLQSNIPNYEKIICYCQEVLELSPENDKAYFRLSQALYKTGDFDGALQACDKCLKCQAVPDTRVVNMKDWCQAELNKQSAQMKTFYGKMLGFK